LSGLGLSLALADFLSDFSLPLPYAATLAASKLKAGQVNAGNRDAHDLFALTAYELSV
jgi:hypothetical protein